MKHMIFLMLSLCLFLGCASDSSVSTSKQATQLSPQEFIGKWKFVITYDNHPDFYRQSILEVTDKEAIYTWEKARGGKMDDKAGSVRGAYEVRGDTLHFVPPKSLSFKMRKDSIEIQDSKETNLSLRAIGKRISQ